ncbi:MAG: KEOPS complex kinase/ATPase Bud32 [Candidatus Woesearchaeota archaeon]
MAGELSRGAEAIITQDKGYVYKTRTRKSYRLEELDDKLRKSRTKREQKVIAKAKKLGIPVPELYEHDDRTVIKMSYVDGQRLRDELLNNPENKHHLKIVGSYVAKLHEHNIIHGDLTTSNIIHTPVDELVLIDFGLSFFSQKIEDKAVDIHLLKQALESTHYKHTEEFYREFLDGYRHYEDASEVLERLKEVEARGRNKH